MFFLAAIPVAASTFWMAIGTELAVIGSAFNLGTQQHAKANIDAEKTIGQFAREGSEHVERTFSVDDYVQEHEYVAARLKDGGCVAESMAVADTTEIIAYKNVSRFENEECRKLGLAAGKEYWENKYARMQSYAKHFLGVDGKLSIAVKSWERSDELVPEDAGIRNRPLVFKGGISFNSIGWHLGGFASTDTYFNDREQFDTEDQKIAKALYMKRAHSAFMEVYSNYVFCLNAYEGALKKL